MHFKVSSFILALAFTTALVLASPPPTRTTREELSINPPASLIRARNVEPISQMQARYLTNGRRLALGLPLKPPRRRRSGLQQLVARASPSPSAKPSSSPSPSPVSTGFIQLHKSGEVLGYVSKHFNSYGEYGNVTTSEDEALKVTLDARAAATGSTDIVTLNGADAEYPYLGAINGYGSTSYDIGPGSSNYQYLGATKQTPQHSPPSYLGNSFSVATKTDETSESAIFGYDAETSVITPQYVNSDGSKPQTSAGINKDGILVLTGDKTAFTTAYGPVDWVTFKFVPA